MVEAGNPRRAARVNGFLDKVLVGAAKIMAAPNVQRPRPLVNFLAARSGQSPSTTVIGLLNAWRLERQQFVQTWSGSGRPVVIGAAGGLLGEAVRPIVKPLFRP